MTPPQFIARFGPMMVVATKGTGLFPSVGIGQSALESGWGTAFIGEANNAFGIKAYGSHTPYWDGSFVVGTGWEQGEEPKQMKWRRYGSVSDSVKDYVYLLANNARYSEAMKKATPEDQVMAIKAAGYASGANYAATVIDIINQNGLKRFDAKKKNMKTVNIILAVVGIGILGWFLYQYATE